MTFKYNYQETSFFSFSLESHNQVSLIYLKEMRWSLTEGKLENITSLLEPLKGSQLSSEIISRFASFLDFELNRKYVWWILKNNYNYSNKTIIFIYHQPSAMRRLLLIQHLLCFTQDIRRVTFMAWLQAEIEIYSISKSWTTIHI